MKPGNVGAARRAVHFSSKGVQGIRAPAELVRDWFFVGGQSDCGGGSTNFGSSIRSFQR